MILTRLPSAGVPDIGNKIRIHMFTYKHSVISFLEMLNINNSVYPITKAGIRIHPNLEKSQNRAYFILWIIFVFLLSLHCSPCKLCFHGNFQKGYSLFVNVHDIRECDAHIRIHMMNVNVTSTVNVMPHWQTHGFSFSAACVVLTLVNINPCTSCEYSPSTPFLLPNGSSCCGNFAVPAPGASHVVSCCHGCSICGFTTVYWSLLASEAGTVLKCQIMCFPCLWKVLRHYNRVKCWDDGVWREIEFYSSTDAIPM